MTKSSAERVFISSSPFLDRSQSWSRQGRWPASWIAIQGSEGQALVAAYRRQFEVTESTTLDIHVSGDERYTLYLDGDQIGVGPERGDESHWAFETYWLTLEPGRHTLVARVHSLGDQRAYAQHTVRHGFLLAPDDPKHNSLLATGVADWDGQLLPGWEFKDPQAAWGTGANLRIHGKEMAWGYQRGEGDRWLAVDALHHGATAGFGSELGPAQLLRPATLLAQLRREWPNIIVRHAEHVATAQTHDLAIFAANNEATIQSNWQALFEGQGSVTIPPQTKQRVLIDFDNYVCGFPELVTTGGLGAHVRVHWQEGLFEAPPSTQKGNRDAIEGKFFATIWSWQDGIGDSFYPAGGQNEFYETLWWQAGRYVEILVETGDEPLTITRFRFLETRYPMEDHAEFSSSDPSLAKIIPLAVRALQECSHETYMDCPYYEQLQYVGDTRLQCLVTYAISPDDRLPRQALRAFDISRQVEGITQSRYPSRVRQIIPPFSLWWVTMVHDFAMWRGDRSLVENLLPGIRGVLDHYRRSITPEGLLGPVPGWNFVDWVPSWRDGQPPTSFEHPTAPIHFQLILALRLAAELEDWMNEPELASRQRRTAQSLSDAASKFWSPARSLYADDLAHEHFSQHSQILAFLSGASKTLPSVDESDQVTTTIYFRHYLFEAMNLIRDGNGVLSRLDLWHSLVQNGLRTTIEMPEPTRSDCHAWGAHPYYHFLTTILGIRPADFGFSRVRIAPNLGLLTQASGTMVHPSGEIRVAFTRNEAHLTAEIVLPEGLNGSLDWGGKVLPLKSGAQTLEI
jgi:alpha-L-rhamnosidase